MLISFSKFNFDAYVCIEAGSIKKLLLDVPLKTIWVEYGNHEDDWIKSKPFTSIEKAKMSFSIMKIFINQTKAGLINYSTEHLNLLKDHMEIEDD